MQVFKGAIFFPVLTYFILEEEAEYKVHIKGRTHCLWRERLYILNASGLLEVYFVSILKHISISMASKLTDMD